MKVLTCKVKVHFLHICIASPMARPNSDETCFFYPDRIKEACIVRCPTRQANISLGQMDNSHG